MPSTWYHTHVYKKPRRLKLENDHEKAKTKKTTEIYEKYQNLDFDHDIRYHLSGYVASRIFSVKLLPQIMAGVAPVWSQHLQHLRHLDLECSVHPWIGDHDLTYRNLLQAAQSWNIGFERLKNLRTLKLSGGGFYNISSGLTNRPSLLLSFGSFRLDNMLESRHFSSLRSLTLKDWLVNKAGMISLISRHSEVLESVTLERISLSDRRLTEGHGWLQVAKALGSCSRLFDISLQDLNSYFIGPDTIKTEVLLQHDIESLYQEIGRNRPLSQDS